MHYYIHCHLTWTNAVHTLYLHCPHAVEQTTLPKVYSKVYTYKADYHC